MFINILSLQADVERKMKFSIDSMYKEVPADCDIVTFKWEIARAKKTIQEMKYYYEKRYSIQIDNLSFENYQGCVSVLIQIAKFFAYSSGLNLKVICNKNCSQCEKKNKDCKILQNEIAMVLFEFTAFYLERDIEFIKSLSHHTSDILKEIKQIYKNRKILYIGKISNN